MTSRRDRIEKLTKHVVILEQQKGNSKITYDQAFRKAAKIAKEVEEKGSKKK